jgi:ornithine carbamoyltransferase
VSSCTCAHRQATACPGRAGQGPTRVGRSGASIDRAAHDADNLPTDLDVVYTTRWQATGTSKPDPDWRKCLHPLPGDADLWRHNADALFMHDLPAHRGEEVTAEVLDGPASVAFDQAENKMHSAMAVLEWCRGKEIGVGSGVHLD